MRQGLAVLHFSLALMAADPPYFLQTIKGTQVPDLFGRYPAEFIPGSLANCKSASSSPTYRSWDCEVTAKLNVQAPSRTVCLLFDRVFIYEYQADPKLPSNLSYSFSGKHQETLSAGGNLDANTSFTFARTAASPNVIRGTVSWNLGIGAGFFTGEIE